MGVSTDHPPLPDYQQPPVNEVVLGVQMEPVPRLVTPYVGLFWKQFRDRYPKAEVQGALDPVLETFGATPSVNAEPPIRFLTQPETPRCWFIAADETELVQLQQDRLIHNWRKRRDTDAYPRYLALRAKFGEEYAALEAFVDAEQLGPFVTNQCEVTYINHLACSSLADWGAPEHFFRSWRAPVGQFLERPEDTRFALRYVMAGDDGHPFGRLHVTAQPAILRAGAPIISLNLTARGRPRGAGAEGVFRFLDAGHEWIVRAFDELTTEGMHAQWGRHA